MAKILAKAFLLFLLYGSTRCEEVCQVFFPLSNTPFLLTEGICPEGPTPTVGKAVKDQDFYEGKLQNKSAHGEGKLIFGGTVYTGKFDSGSFLQGTWEDKDGRKFEGSFSDYLPVGISNFSIPGRVGTPVLCEHATSGEKDDNSHRSIQVTDSTGTRKTILIKDGIFTIQNEKTGFETDFYMVYIPHLLSKAYLWVIDQTNSILGLELTPKGFTFSLWILSVFLGMVLGGYKVIIVYENYTDLFICFCIGAWPILLFFFLGILTHPDMTPVLISCVLIEIALILWSLWKSLRLNRFNPVYWYFSFLTKMSLGFLFVSVLWLFWSVKGSRKKADREARATYGIILSIAGPIMLALIREHDGIRFLKRMMWGIR